MVEILTIEQKLTAGGDFLLQFSCQIISFIAIFTVVYMVQNLIVKSGGDEPQKVEGIYPPSVGTPGYK